MQHDQETTITGLMIPAYLVGLIILYILVFMLSEVDRSRQLALNEVKLVMECSSSLPTPSINHLLTINNATTTIRRTDTVRLFISFFK